MNIHIDNAPRIVNATISVLQQYAKFIFIILMLGLYGYLVLHVSSLIQADISQTDVLEQMESTNRAQVDERAVERILTLQDQNVQVESIFEEARDNPFSE